MNHVDLPLPSETPPRLTLNGVDLMVAGSGKVGGDRIDFHAEGTALASPEAVVQTVASWTGDGAVEWVAGHQNVTHPVRVSVSGDNSDDLDENVRRLRAACGPGILKYQPPHEFARPVVWMVQWTQATKVADWTLETRRVRIYDLTIRCWPHSYADREVTVQITSTATPPTAGHVFTSKSNAAAAGWDAFFAQHGGGVSGSVWSSFVDVTSVRVRARTQDVNDYAGVLVRRIPPGGDSTWNQARRLLRSTVPDVAALTVRVNGQALQLVGRSGSDWWHQVPDSVTAVTELSWEGSVVTGTGPSAWRTLEVGGYAWASALPAAATNREVQGSVVASGTAPTPVTVDVAPTTGNAAAGAVLVHTWAEAEGGYSGPNVSVHRTTGSAVAEAADTHTVSGTGVDISSGVRWEVPCSRLPEGVYTLWVLARRPAGAATMNFTVAGRVANPVTSGSTMTPIKTKAARLLGPRYSWVSLGPVVLPQRAVDPGTATQILEITAAGVRVDQVLLTIQEVPGRPGRVGATATCRTVSVSRVSIRPPTPTQPAPRVMGGISADGGDMIALDEIGAMGDLTLQPGANRIYIVASGATGGIGVTVTYRPAGIDVPPAVD